MEVSGIHVRCRLGSEEALQFISRHIKELLSRLKPEAPRPFLPSSFIERYLFTQ